MVSKNKNKNKNQNKNKIKIKLKLNQLKHNIIKKQIKTKKNKNKIITKQNTHTYIYILHTHTLDYTLNLMPNYSAALEHKAALLCRLNNHKEAIKQCKNAISANPKPLSFSFRYLAAVECNTNMNE